MEMPLRASVSHICTLVRLEGSGAGGRVYLGEDGSWKLERFLPSAPDDFVSARCYLKRAFHIHRGGSLSASRNFAQEAAPDCATTSTTLQRGDALTILQGVRGLRRDVNVSDVELIPSSGQQSLPSPRARLNAAGCAITAFANALRFDRMPWRIGAYGPNGYYFLGDGGDFVAVARTEDGAIASESTEKLVRTITLEHMNTNFCFLSSIAGDFRHSGSVAILKRNRHWVLEVSGPNLQTNAPVTARARCISSVQLLTPWE